MPAEPNLPRAIPGGAAALPERPDGRAQDDLLDEALEETFPASDPISVYRPE
jgi:hypothetical protein